MSLNDGPMIVTSIERLKVKLVAWSRLPKSEVVCVKSIETWDGSIISHSDYDFTTFPVCSLSTIVIVLLDVSIKPYRVGNISSLNLPRVAV